MKITLAQLNPVIGDFTNNLSGIETSLHTASKHSSDLIVFSELILSGYPPKDLLERKDFNSANSRALDRCIELSRSFAHMGILIGTFERITTGKTHCLYNSAVLIQDGKVLHTQRKTLLPTYDVFDEKRYFTSAGPIDAVPFKDEVLGITICEDAWNNPDVIDFPVYDADPVAELRKQGATIILNISASPFTLGKEHVRYSLVASHAAKHKVPFIMVNQTGANDELIFDGRSLAVNARGELICMLPAFEESVQTIDTADSSAIDFRPVDRIQAAHDAVVLGIRDYLRKCGFSKAVIGLSGGIDSAVCCALACRALGPGNVVGIAMPSPISSKSSIDDAKDLAENLGIEFMAIPIGDIFAVYKSSLSPVFKNLAQDETEENIQARIRGNLLMAMSNKYGYIVLTTGNKSEMSVGYCTLYGDMSGGLAVLADIPKVLLYKIADYINRESELIPQSTIDKPPSAELRPDQQDEDTLPPYDILDAILELYVEQGKSKQEIVDKGFNPDTVQWIIHAVAKNEHKRRQAPPVLKITSKAFGTGRRMPIAAKYSTEQSI